MLVRNKSLLRGRNFNGTAAECPGSLSRPPAGPVQNPFTLSKVLLWPLPGSRSKIRPQTPGPGTHTHTVTGPQLLWGPASGRAGAGLTAPRAAVIG